MLQPSFQCSAPPATTEGASSAAPASPRPCRRRPASPGCGSGKSSCQACEEPAVANHLRPRLQRSQRNRIIRGSSSGGTAPRSAVCGNTSPCWIDREVVPAADQDFSRGSCAHHGCRAHTEWIGNEKSASRIVSTFCIRLKITEAKELDSNPRDGRGRKLVPLGLVLEIENRQLRR